MATTKRIYLVTRLVKDVDADRSKPEHRLVNASSAQAAIRHVTAQLYQCSVATPREVAEVAGKGVTVEETGDA